MRGAPLATVVAAAMATVAGGRASARQVGEPGATSATDQLRRSQAALVGLLARRAPDWSPEAEWQQRTILKILGDEIDYDEIARRALGDHWDGLSAAERSAFVEALRSLANDQYLRRIARLHRQLRYDNETRTAGEARVAAVVLGPDGSVDAHVEYRCRLKAGRWVVDDLVVDGASLVDEYRQQFDRLLSRESFAAVLDRMRSRAAERRR